MAGLLPTTTNFYADGHAPNMTMGLAWQRYPFAADFPLPYVFKNGGSTGFSSATIVVPDKKWAVTILCNGGALNGSTEGQAVQTAALEIMKALARESILPGSGSSFGS